jgi:hypothetical protein
VEAHLTAARFSPSLMRSSCTHGMPVCCRAATVVVCLTLSCSEEGPDGPRAHDSAEVCGYARSVGLYGSLPLDYSGHLQAVLWVLKGGTLGT